jgi:CDP-diacylglycerol--serine O-phosphatidyltransferase
MITFGLTPAVCCYIYAHVSQTLGLWDGWGRYDRTLWICCAVYVSCAALRLARYNVKAWEQSMLPADQRSKEQGFTGIPSPGAASGICSILLMANSPVFVGPQANFDLPPWVITVFLPCYCVLLGGLMVSNVPYPHVGKWLLSGKSLPRKLLVLGALFGTAGVEAWQLGHAPVVTAAVVISLYILSGPLLLLLRWFGQKIRAGHEDEEEA